MLDGKKTLLSLSKSNVNPIKALAFNLSAINVKSIVTLELSMFSLCPGLGSIVYVSPLFSKPKGNSEKPKSVLTKLVL